MKECKYDLPSPAVVSVNSKPDTHGCHVSFSLCSLLELDCEISHWFLSFSRFLYQLHLSATKLLQGQISEAAGLVSERAAWHRGFPADIGDTCSSRSSRCWNPRKSRLFLQQWADECRAPLETSHTLEELYMRSRVPGAGVTLTSDV